MSAACLLHNLFYLFVNDWMFMDFVFVCECLDVYGSFVFVVFVSAWLFMGVFFPPSVCVCVKIHVDYNINCYSVS